jgi:outer membrane receptor protein involved in Fe transport
MTAAFAYQNAKLREAEPDLRASAGERLPNVPRFTAVLNADYKLSPAGLQPSIGATFRHTGARNAGFGIAPPQYNLPGYSTVDLRGGISVNQIDVQLYVRNLFDKRGQAAAFVDTGFPRITVLQPRTIGISASTSF